MVVLSGCLEAPNIGEGECFNSADCDGQRCDVSSRKCIVERLDGAIDPDMPVPSTDMSVREADMTKADTDMSVDGHDMSVVKPDATGSDGAVEPAEECTVGATTQVYESASGNAPILRVAANGDGEWGVAWNVWSPERVSYKFRCYVPGVPVDDFSVLFTGEVPPGFATQEQPPDVAWNGAGYSIAHPDDLDPGDEREHHPRLALSQTNPDCNSVDAENLVTFPKLGVLSTRLLHDGEAHMLVWEGGDEDGWEIQFNRFGHVLDLSAADEPARPLIPGAGKPQAVWNPHSEQLGIAYGAWEDAATGVNTRARQFDRSGRQVGFDSLLLANTADSDKPVAATTVGDQLAVAYVQSRAPEDNPLSFVPLSFGADGLDFIEPARDTGASLHLAHFGVDIAFDPETHVYAVAWIDVDPAERKSLLKVSIFDEHADRPREVIRIHTDEARDADSPRIEWAGEGRGFALFWSEGGPAGGIFHSDLRCPPPRE